MGRPAEGEGITDDELDRFVGAVREVGHVEIAANICGRTGNAFRYWMDKKPDFKRRFLEAQGAWAAEQLDRVKSGEWNLARIYPEHMGDRQTIEHEGGVQVILQPHPDLLDDEPAE